MKVLGVDIGGTGIKGAVVDTSTGELKTERLRLLTPQPATPEAVASVLKDLVDQIGFKGPVACGFPARIINGIALTAANIDKSWINVPVEKLFSKALGRDVYVANDADVAGLAELEIGAAKGMGGVVLFLTLGTGIGSAIFVNGELYPNTELGHIIFKDDHAEHYCSAAVKERSENMTWKEWGTRLDSYLQYISFLLCPDVIVLGGGVSKKFDKYKDKLTVSAKVIPAMTLNNAGIIGAALYGARRLKGLGISGAGKKEKEKNKDKDKKEGKKAKDKKGKD